MAEQTISALELTRKELESLSASELAKITKAASEATKHMRWIPSDGPQYQAYHSEADVLLYGGEPGGGKTDLALGLAFNCHERSLIMRRQYTDLGGIIDRMIQINGGKDGYNGAPPPSIKKGSLSIELGAASKVGDEMSWQGRARDLLVLDEATQFAKQQVRFLMGWVRSSNPKQRCRTVFATNPPLTSEGQWVIEMFAPWLDDRYPNPARPGELRWVITDEFGNDRWVEGPGKYTVHFPKGDKEVLATSRTYIPSSLQDNPFLNDGKYEAQLDAMTEPWRSLLLSGFKYSSNDAPNQVIPTAWIRAAQERWRESPLRPTSIPMCSIGVDCSGGGKDPLVMAPRYDAWFAPLIEVPGREIPKLEAGSFMASKVLLHRTNSAQVVIDMGGGFGSSLYEILHRAELPLTAYKGNSASNKRSRDRKFEFYNVRSQAYWQFREALDPEQPGGALLALPDDPVLVADLTAPTIDMNYRGGIKIETKEDVCKRLGRSTNRGDAAVMSWFDGPKALTHLDKWEHGGLNTRRHEPVVKMGRQEARYNRVGRRVH